MLDAYADDIDVRVRHVQPSPPELDIRPFALSTTPVDVWCSHAGDVRVEAVAVHHEPVFEAVGYRITTPTAVIVVSGDTRVCDEVLHHPPDPDDLIAQTFGPLFFRRIVADQPADDTFIYCIVNDALARGSGRQ